MHQPNTDQKPNIQYLFSNPDGGYYSPTKAIIESLEIVFSDHFTCETGKVFKKYVQPPFDSAPDSYAPMAQIPGVREFK